MIKKIRKSVFKNDKQNNSYKVITEIIKAKKLKSVTQSKSNKNLRDRRKNYKSKSFI